MSELEQRMEEVLRVLLGDMAPVAINNEKTKLGIADQPLDQQYLPMVAEGVRQLCADMAGDDLARNIYNRLMSLADN